ncbi:MAG: Gfo/Idh/MocA family oxidoreductase [Achromobacter sp.]|uniref:Gfo/Idh/MocA family oxidoreductase n=1 Tax=Achromobacter sp. TaxID=134375 RepID=UPI003D0660D6
MTTRPSRLRAVVCGTTFGQTYLNGLTSLPEHFELAGILARGSPFARACAERHRVPLYTAVEQLPPAIDLACVVVRSGVVGGAGTALAKALLERGVHVLQEQPVHHDELASLLRLARKAGCQYRLNGFYPDVAPVARFIAAARHVLGKRRALFLDAACSIHVLYPLIDIIGQALGGLRPWFFVLQSVAESDAGPFTCVSGRLGGVPLTLRVQNQLDPRDPDNYIHLFHQIALGTDGGTLTLVDSHGQLLWHPRMHLERRGDGVIDLSAEHQAVSLSVSSTIGPAAAPSYHQVFNEYWAKAVARGLLRFRDAILAGSQDTALHQYMLGAAKAWGELGMQLGPPRDIAPPDTLPLAVDGIAAHVQASVGT